MPIGGSPSFIISPSFKFNLNAENMLLHFVLHKCINFYHNSGVYTYNSIIVSFMGKDGLIHIYF